MLFERVKFGYCKEIFENLIYWNFLFNNDGYDDFINSYSFIEDDIN